MLTGIAINFSPSDRARLVGIAADRNSPQKHVWRAQMVLLSADGIAPTKSCASLARPRRASGAGNSVHGGGHGRVAGGQDPPSRIPSLDTAVVARAVALTPTVPPGETTHWTAAVASACSISISSVHRIWRSHGLRPHQIHQFKLSNDPNFAAKVRDIVGLYVNPPEHAVVLSVDEKSQIQALV